MSKIQSLSYRIRQDNGSEFFNIDVNKFRNENLPKANDEGSFHFLVIC